MAQLDVVEKQDISFGAKVLAWFGRVFLAVIIPLIAFAVIYAGFIFLRDSDAPRWVITIVAIIWGVGGLALLYWVFNGIVERLPRTGAFHGPRIEVGHGILQRLRFFQRGGPHR